MVNIVVISILLIVWVFLPINGVIDQLREPKAVFLDMTALSIIGYSLIEGIKFTYRNKYLGWLSLWIFFTIFMNWYKPLMMQFNNERIYHIWTLEQSVHFIFLLFMSYILLCSLEYKDFIKIAQFICLSAVLVSLFGILQVTGLDPLRNIVKYKQHEQWHFSALIDHPDTIGNYLALSLPFFLFFQSHKYRIGFFIVLLGIFLSRSTLSIGVTLLGLCLYLILFNRKKISFIFVSSIMTLFLLFCFYHPFFTKIINGFSGRIEAWKVAIELIKNNPIFGNGMGAFYDLGFTPGSMTWVFVHNDYLERTCEIGLLGVSLFLCVISHSIKNFNYKQSNTLGFCYFCSFIIFLFLMIGSFPMETAPSALLGILGWIGVEKII